jgi:uncharacterized repeat protein (TIGR01451 family)
MKHFFTFICLSFFSFSLPAQNFEWAASVSSTTISQGSKIKTDAAGNIYTYGFYTNTCDFDPGPGTHNLTTSATGSYFLQKLNSNGDLLWVKQFNYGTSPFIYLSWFDIEFDSSGNIYLSGNFNDNVDFDPGPGTHLISGDNSLKSFILKLDNTGAFVWVSVNNCAGSSNSSEGFDLTLDNSGNLYYTGHYKGSVDFDPSAATYSLTAPAMTENVFIQKLSASGALIWAKSFICSTQAHAQCIIIDATQDLYISGAFVGTCDMDPGASVYNVSSPSSSIMANFVTKLTSSGNFLWAKTWGNTANINMGECDNIVTDTSGYINLMGHFTDSFDCDPGPGVANITAVPATSDNVFIVRLSASGTYIDSKVIGGGSVIASSILIDSTNHTYLAGFFKGTVDFDPSSGICNLSSTSSTVEDIFVAKLSENSSMLWTRQLSSPDTKFCPSLALGSNNELLGTGYFYGTLDFDYGPGAYILSSLGMANAFTFKWSQDLCSDMNVFIDDVNNITCSDSGQVTVHAGGGILPYTYNWLTTPPVLDSVLDIIDTAGFYVVQVTDSIGCIKTASVLVNGTSSPFIDLAPYLVAPAYRPATLSPITLYVGNHGCIPANGTVDLILDPLVSFTTASLPPDSILGNTLKWNFTSLTQDSIMRIIVQFNVSASALIGDTLCFSSTINTGSPEINTANNTATICRPVVSSYDPNRKSVYPQGKCAQGYIKNDQLMTYMVEFQNTGNAVALNIFILDTIDTSLNLSTVRMISSTHSVTVQALPGNVLKFNFADINLPDSTSNEEQSHGHFVFEIEPYPSLALGTEITNQVGIYFDTNPPVYTNTVLNTITDEIVNIGVTTVGDSIVALQPNMTYQWLNCDLGYSVIAGETGQSFIPQATGTYAVAISDGCYADTSTCVNITIIGIEENKSPAPFSVHPNPAQNTLTVSTEEPFQLCFINILGSTILRITVKNNEQIDISELNSGVYFLLSEHGRGSIRLVKQ